MKFFPKTKHKYGERRSVVRFAILPTLCSSSKGLVTVWLEDYQEDQMFDGVSWVETHSRALTNHFYGTDLL